MHRNKRQAVLFFESNATLMSNQIRQLVTDSLQQFRSFFERFNKPTLNTPEEVVAIEKDARNPIEDVFLHVKLEAQQEGAQIVFADDLEEKIKSEILKVIDKILHETHDFPRPENHIARSDKVRLWDIPEWDEVYVRVRQEIGEILDKNLKNVAKVLSIY
jgi:dynein heavy chain